MNNQVNVDKIPLHMLDEVHLQSAFSASSMQIFHSNEIRLAELLQQINSLYSSSRAREMMVKIFSVFEELKIIFFRLGLIDLFEQLKLIVNAISKLVLLYEPKANGRTSKKNFEKIQKIEKQMNKQTIQGQISEDLCLNGVKNKKNRLRGIFLYNESYQKNVQPKQKLTKQQQSNIKQFQQQQNKQQQLQKQEMWFYIERKKDLSQIKIKDNSKNYKQIENQFKVVQQRLIHALQGLHIQINHQNIKQSQYLSREQINSQLGDFNNLMREQILGLKSRYEEVRDGLLSRITLLNDRLNQEINKKNFLISAEVQTTQSISSYKKTKKICDEFQYRIRRLEEKNAAMKQSLTESEQKQQQLLQEVHLKTKQLDSLSKKYVQKEKIIQQLNDKCKSLKEIIQELQFNINYDLVWKNIKTEKKIILEQDLESIKKRKGIMNKFNSKDRSIKIASKKEFASNKKIIQERTQLEQDIENGKEIHIKQGKNFLSSITLIQPRMNQNSFQNEVLENNLNETKNLMSSKKNASDIKELINKNGKQQSLSFSKQKSSAQDKRNKKVSDLLKETLNELKDIQNKSNEKEKRKSNLSDLKEKLSMKKQNSPKVKESFGRQQRNSKTSSSFYRPSVVVKDESQNQTVVSLHHSKHKQNFILKKGNIKKSGKSRVEKSYNLFDTIDVVNLSRDNEVLSPNPKQLSLQKQSKQSKTIVPNFRDVNKINQKEMKELKKLQKEQLKKTNSEFCFEIQNKKSSEWRGQNKQQVLKRRPRKTIDQIIGKTSLKASQLKVSQLNDKQKAEILRLSEHILKVGNISKEFISEMAQNYPEIISGLKQQEFRETLLKQLARFHQKKCKQNNCLHLQTFVQFCFKTQFRSEKRQSMKLPIQDFSNI